MRRLETHYRDLCDIEFTIERGKLWMLQTRVGKRTAGAAFRIAAQLVDEQLITLDEALDRVTGSQLAQLMFPQFDRSAHRDLLTKGMAASPGAAVGRVVFDSPTAKAWADRGEQVVLVRQETNPDDLEGMIAAEASSPPAAAKPATPPWLPAGWARPASAAPRRWTSTPAPDRSGGIHGASTRAT